MSIKLSHKNMIDLYECLESKYDTLAETIQPIVSDSYDDYYFYGYSPLDASYSTIPITQLRSILRYDCIKQNSELYRTILDVYLAGDLTRQDHVFLYGRCKA